MADLDALVRRINDEVISQGKVELVDELLAEDFVERQAMPGMPSDRDALKVFTEMFRSAFPDLKVSDVYRGTSPLELCDQAGACEPAAELLR